MNSANYYRAKISTQLKRLRREKDLTQKELSQLIELSQAQYSKIENGQGSLSAEQFLLLLAHLNCSLDIFIKDKNKEANEANDEEISLTKAMTRWGATHLDDKNDILVPEKYNHLNTILLDVLLIYPQPLYITNCAPMIATHFNLINFGLVATKLNDRLGSENRWWWLIESTYQAIQNRLSQTVISRKRVLLYKRALLYLESKITFREKITKLTSHFATPEDLLDENITSKTKIDALIKNRDPLAKKWRLVTDIRQMDFDEALKESEV